MSSIRDRSRFGSRLHRSADADHRFPVGRCERRRDPRDCVAAGAHDERAGLPCVDRAETLTGFEVEEREHSRRVDAGERARFGTGRGAATSGLGLPEQTASR